MQVPHKVLVVKLGSLFACRFFNFFIQIIQDIL